MTNSISEPIIYQTVQVIPVSIVKAELEKIYAKLDELESILIKKRDERIISDAQAARRISKSTRTIHRMKIDKRINSIITPRGLMVRVCDVDDYLEFGKSLE